MRGPQDVSAGEGEGAGVKDGEVAEDGNEDFFGKGGEAVGIGPDEFLRLGFGDLCRDGRVSNLEQSKRNTGHSRVLEFS